MEALIGVVVGAVLTATLGLLRDSRERRHRTLTDLRERRLTMLAELFAAADMLWRARESLTVAVDQMRTVHDDDDPYYADAGERAERGGVDVRAADRACNVALGRVRLLAPGLADDAQGLVDLCRSHDYRDEQSRTKIQMKQLDLEDKARALLGFN